MQPLAMKPLGLMLLTLGAVACQTTPEFSLETQYPVVVEVINSGDRSIHLDGLVSAPEVRQKFVILGQRLAPQQRFTTRTTEEVATLLHNGAFVVIALCPGEPDFWRKPGGDIARVSTSEPLVIEIRAC